MLMNLPLYNMSSPTTVYYDVGYDLLEQHWISKLIKICALLNSLNMVDFFFYILTCRPVAGQRLCKHIPTSTNKQATIG
jgi:hypothetical protein